MATYKHDDYDQPVLLPVSLEPQLMPGTWEFAIHVLVPRHLDTSIFESRDKNGDTGRPAYDPQILLKVVFFAYSRGIISSRKIAQACRENITFIALACGLVPDHSTIAAFISSMQAQIVALCRDILLVCEEQGLFGGTHFALDGLKLSSNAAKAWRGTFADLRQKKENLEAKVKSLLKAHARADQEGAAPSIVEPRAEPDKVQEQMARWEKQAARIEKFLAQSEPQRGKRGKALQSHVTDNDSAKMQTAPGVMPGDNGQALVDAQPQVIVHAEAFGNGQDDGHVAPMVEGAQATVQAIGLPAAYFEGKLFSADRQYPSEGNLARWAPEQLEASIPDPQFRARDPRFATQGRHKPQTAEKFTVADCTDDKAHDCYPCPSGKVLKLDARRHKIGNNIDRRYEANEADCNACLFREQCWQHAATCRKHLAVYVEPVHATLSQQRVAKIDTPEARQI